MKRLCLTLAALLLAWPAFALDPSEMLPDPAQEALARELDHEIRCVKCQSETIASSNADWAQDARRAVRELIADGRSQEEVKAFFVERYGQVVLMTPPTSGMSLLLWAAGPLMLLAALGIGFSYVRTRSAASPDRENALSETEQARLDALLKE